MPGSRHAWPNRAACWSPAMPDTGMPAATPVPSAVTPNRPLEGRTSGRALAGTPNRSSSSSDHANERMSNSIVRLALDGSVANTPPSTPPVRFHSTHASMVPTARSGVTATPPSPSNHSTLVAEKYGSRTSPVVARTIGSAPSARRASQRAAVRRSCHTMARCRGWPVRRSHATTVSRWSVMPMAAMGSVRWPASSASVVRTASQISLASCSTHPGLGKCWVNSRYANPAAVPSSRTANERTPVVPASMASTTDIGATYALGNAVQCRPAAGAFAGRRGSASASEIPYRFGREPPGGHLCEWPCSPAAATAPGSTR